MLALIEGERCDKMGLDRMGRKKGAWNGGLGRVGRGCSEGKRK